MQNISAYWNQARHQINSEIWYVYIPHYYNVTQNGFWSWKDPFTPVISQENVWQGVFQESISIIFNEIVIDDDIHECFLQIYSIFILDYVVPDHPIIFAFV